LLAIRRLGGPEGAKSFAHKGLHKLVNIYEIVLDGRPGMWYNGSMKNKELLIPSLGRILDLSSIVIDGVDMSDAFDFCDAFVSEALWTDGFRLGADELDIIMENDDVQMLVHEKACSFAGF